MFKIFSCTGSLRSCIKKAIKWKFSKSIQQNRKTQTKRKKKTKANLTKNRLLLTCMRPEVQESWYQSPEWCLYSGKRLGNFLVGQIRVNSIWNSVPKKPEFPDYVLSHTPILITTPSATSSTTKTLQFWFSTSCGAKNQHHFPGHQKLGLASNLPTACMYRFLLVDVFTNKKLASPTSYVFHDSHSLWEGAQCSWITISIFSKQHTIHEYLFFTLILCYIIEKYWRQKYRHAMHSAVTVHVSIL